MIKKNDKGLTDKRLVEFWGWGVYFPMVHFFCSKKVGLTTLSI